MSRKRDPDEVRAVILLTRSQVLPRMGKWISALQAEETIRGEPKALAFGPFVVS